MSFREKSAWISLLTTLGIWGTYFWVIGGELLDRGSLAGLGDDAVGLFVGAVIALIIVQIVLAIAVTIVSGRQADEPMDERERLIDLKGTRLGFYALNAAVICVSALWLFGASPLVMANGILLAVVVGEVVQSAGKIVAYRRGLA